MRHALLFFAEATSNSRKPNEKNDYYISSSSTQRKFDSTRALENLLRKRAPVGMVHQENEDVKMEKIAENAETPEKFVHYESDADNTEKIVEKFVHQENMGIEKKAENLAGNYAVENLSPTRQYQSALCHLYFAVECFQLMQWLERAVFRCDANF